MSREDVKCRHCPKSLGAHATRWRGHIFEPARAEAPQGETCAECDGDGIVPCPKCRPAAQPAPARDEAPQGEVQGLPAHLRDDAPFVRCSGCGRKTWTPSDRGSICGMPQPDGRTCTGRFPSAAQPETGGCEARVLDAYDVILSARNSLSAGTPAAIIMEFDRGLALLADAIAARRRSGT